MSDDLAPILLTVCSYCRAGAGGECHTPGCAFCRSTAPDLPLTAALSREDMIDAARGEMHDRSREGASFADAEAVLRAAGVIAAEVPA